MSDTDNNFPQDGGGHDMPLSQDEPEQTPSADDRIVALETELAETKDRLLRALAEAENQRQRHQRDRLDATRFAASNFARELLSVADNLHRALASAGPSQDDGQNKLLEGVAATERELLAIFERHGMKRIEPQLGERFDHNLHQAMYEVDTVDYPSGTVAQLLQPGYLMHDRLLRPALVGVAKEPAERPEN
jgi:molecular chaperone GrpE